MAVKMNIILTIPLIHVILILSNQKGGSTMLLQVTLPDQLHKELRMFALSRGFFLRDLVPTIIRLYLESESLGVMKERERKEGEK